MSDMRRADMLTIPELTDAIRALQEQKFSRDRRIAELEPLVAEHTRLVGEREAENCGPRCLGAMRGVLGVKLTRRELGEE
jgi:hypothetical protein